MTPEYILRKSLCRPAHCFSAHVPGQGYVNRRGLFDPGTDAEYDRQRKVRAESAISNLQTAHAYAEPGYTDPARGILFADWNIFPRGIDTILERYGYAIEWEDEWTTCHGCGKAVRTSPDSYSYTPSYSIVNECELYCVECLQEGPAEHLRSLEDNPQTCNTIAAIRPEDHGYIKANEHAYETGFFPGQNDRPEDVYRKLTRSGHKRIVFSIDEQSQFYTKWSAYYNDTEDE